MSAKITVFLFLFLTSSCSWISQKSLTSSHYKQNNELIILTKNKPFSYYEDHTGQEAGYEHDLIKQFAESQGMNVRFVLRESSEDILDDLKLGRGHLAMSGILSRVDLKKDFLQGPPVFTVSQKLLCRKSYRKTSIQRLKNRKIGVVSEGEEGSLKQRELKKMHPEVQWVVSEKEERSLAEWVNLVLEKKLSCLLVDFFLWDMNRQSFSPLKVVQKLNSSDVVWVMTKRQSRLQKDLDEWMSVFQKTSAFRDVQKRYLNWIGVYNSYDAEVFLKRIKSHLPALLNDFKNAAMAYDFDWRLLAAIAYQESHWQPQAESPTGVRGIMMLTQKTATELGVKDRLNPQQSIEGGSRYLKNLIKRMPAFLDEKDKLYFGLAAYNVGFAHLQDARKLSIDLKKNPNTWDSVRSVLPLLAKKKYYSRLRHGFARGGEPVIYIRRVFQYYELLKIEFPET